MDNEEWAENQALAAQAAANRSMRPLTSDEVRKIRAVNNTPSGRNAPYHAAQTKYTMVHWIRDYRNANGGPTLREAKDTFDREHPGHRQGDPVQPYVPLTSHRLSGASTRIDMDLFVSGLAENLRVTRPANSSGYAPVERRADTDPRYRQWLRDVKALTHSLMGSLDRFNARTFAELAGTSWEELDSLPDFDETDDLLSALARGEAR